MRNPLVPLMNDRRCSRDGVFSKLTEIAQKYPATGAVDAVRMQHQIVPLLEADA